MGRTRPELRPSTCKAWFRLLGCAEKRKGGGGASFLFFSFVSTLVDDAARRQGDDGGHGLGEDADGVNAKLL